MSKNKKQPHTNVQHQFSGMVSLTILVYILLLANIEHLASTEESWGSFDHKMAELTKLDNTKRRSGICFLTDVLLLQRHRLRSSDDIYRLVEECLSRK